MYESHAAPAQTPASHQIRKLALVLLALLSTGWLIASLVHPASAQTPKPLPPDRAFTLSVERSSQGNILLNWQIAANTYLYRDKFEVHDSGGKSIRAALPSGEMKDDQSFGLTEIFHERVTLTIAADELRDLKTLTVTYQGCAEKGICYPPVEKTVDLSNLAVRDIAPRDFSNVTLPSLSTRTTLPTSTTTPTAPSAETSMLTGAIVPVLLAFFGLGLLLAFTPCVFPMIPILSGILVGSGGSSVKRGVAISGAYVLAMATAYASLGLVASWSGQNLQLLLQTPVTLLIIGAAFVALALSMFGLFELQLPAGIIPQVSMRRDNLSASVASAVLLGFGAALIVGPCVTPPLAAALLYVAQTGDVTRGTAALFALGLGMGAPLLAFGIFGPRVLPRSGAWLLRIKHLFGFVFLALAIWMVSRIVPHSLIWAACSLWIFSLFVYAAVLVRGANWQIKSVRTQFALAFMAAIALGLPALVMPNLNGSAGPAFGLSGETTVHTSAALDNAIANAKSNGRTVFVSFSADWCVECKLLARNVFGAPRVQQHMQDVQVIHADVTTPSSDSLALMKRFDVVGPPTMFFLDTNTGEEIPGSRSIGSIDAEAFIAKIPKGKS